MNTLRLWATAPRGLTDLLAKELAALGALEVHERAGAVSFGGTLETVYRACLESRLANRVLLEIARFEAADTEAFYRAARAVHWSAQLKPGASLACGFSGRHPTIVHSHFGALKLKDAIVDALREATGSRPDVVLDRPGLRVHAHAHDASITLSIDLSGESLHRRGYRSVTGEAPLKENVAAGVLERSGWPQLAASGAQFLDPLCGSGTLVIEAALMAAHCAPGLNRRYFGFLGWRGHDEALWSRVREEAVTRSLAGGAPTVIIRGQDRDPAAIRDARANAERAGVAQWVRFEVRPLSEAVPDETGDPQRGLLCTNPPYGVRLEDLEAARAVHRELGEVLRERFQGWQASVLTGAPQLGMELGIRAARTHTLWNGAIECRLLRMTVEPRSLRRPGTLAKSDVSLSETPGARMFANRLAKNLKRLKSWAQREDVSCYRLYDADMPEYAFAIDLYRTVQPPEDWLYVQEYAAPEEIEAEAVRRRRGEVLASLPGVTGVPRERIKVRVRRRTRRGEQYEKLAGHAEFHIVSEGGLRFAVNFGDYLDTGLFLDHRLTRERLRREARARRFLNLFAYTGTATVYAASGGAAETTSIDLSRTYLDWAERNLELNGFAGPRNQLLQADCLQWLREGSRERYDLIFLDPPTFSNSKRMEEVLDVQRDHGTLIEGCMRRLAPGGVLIFSTNAQRFRLEPALQERYAVRDVSAATLPRDFERNPRIHRCFELRLPESR